MTTHAPDTITQIAQLPHLSMQKLWAMWDDLFDRRPGHHQRTYLESRIAYRLQERAFGALPGHIRRKLELIGKTGEIPNQKRRAETQLAVAQWQRTEAPFFLIVMTPVPPSNRVSRHTYNPLFSNAFCVCQMSAVLRYFLRTESKTESKQGENAGITGTPRTPWHTQNGPGPRVAWGKPRSDKANR